jgi:hypothetical protein
VRNPNSGRGSSEWLDPASGMSNPTPGSHLSDSDRVPSFLHLDLQRDYYSDSNDCEDVEAGVLDHSPEVGR